jgi:hypothetical protein
MKRRRGTHRPVGQWGYLSAASTYHIYQDLGLGDSQPQDLPITNCRLANGQRLGIEEIRVGRSFMQTLVTFLTLGLWAPTRISWRCARPLSQSGTLD